MSYFSEKHVEEEDLTFSIYPFISMLLRRAIENC
jgi:hypothetical protein